MFIGEKLILCKFLFNRHIILMAVGSASHFQSVPFTIELGSGKVDLCGKDYQ
jgi:hypothetical protein